MISGIFHQGSGLGNQLHRYVATRVLALDKNLPFGMAHPQLFKGDSFMKIDKGEKIGLTINYFQPTGYVPVMPPFLPNEPQLEFSTFNEHSIKDEFGNDVRPYDPEFNFIEANTLIDGEFQDERYFEHRMKEIDEWLRVEVVNILDDVCVIGFRGGEFYQFPDLGLPKEYFEEGIIKMKEINPSMKFEVHTDDEQLAKKFFPDYPIIHDIGINWRSMRYSKYAIIANSSFYIFPRLLNGGMTIAPRYWARYNTKTWCLPQNYYKDFIYV